MTTPTRFGAVVDAAGGGLVTLVVDRDTESYPQPGQHVTVAASPTAPSPSVAELMAKVAEAARVEREIAQQLVDQRSLADRHGDAMDALRAARIALCDAIEARS